LVESLPLLRVHAQKVCTEVEALASAPYCGAGAARSRNF
jgi:hypothetical protein